jgi:hypothetical protein
MNSTISEKKRAQLIAQLDQLRKEVKELQSNPQPRPDLLESFRQAFREDKPVRPSTERPSI